MLRMILITIMKILKWSPSNHWPPDKRRKLSSPNSKILQKIAGVENDDATGDQILQQLVDTTKRWGKKLSSSENLKSLLNIYDRPEKLGDVKGTKVNPEMWTQQKAEN